MVRIVSIQNIRMAFSLAALETMGSPEVIRRGKEYMRAGAVQAFRRETLSNGDEVLRGRVRGLEWYDVSVQMIGITDVVRRTHCPCRQSGGGICTHIAALGWYAVSKGTSQDAPTSLPLLAKKKKVVSRMMRGRSNEDSGRSRGTRVFLDGIDIELIYDQAKDVMRVHAWVRYGKLRLPLLTDEEDAAHAAQTLVPEREWEVEEDAAAFLSGHMTLLDPRDRSTYIVRGEELFSFIKETVPELEYRFHVVPSESAKPLLTIERAAIRSEWSATQKTGIDWFEFAVGWHCDNADVDTGALKHMIDSHKPYIRTADGQFVECANREEIERTMDFLERSKAVGNGSFASRLYAVPEMLALIQTSKESRLKQTNERFEAFLNETKQGAPLEPVMLPSHLDRVLRPYQKDGVAWAIFLQKYHFGGILADDMGLGKTVQVLALLSMSRERVPKPALIVCPKTLLLTWLHEAKTFTPELRVLLIDGLSDEREALMRDMMNYDVVVTSYSLLQRDIQQYVSSGVTFGYCILDEAQYIKNAKSITAEAVKLVPAEHRLALTGTPLENGVQELWSIFDFLMPGFLGDQRAFRTRFEQPIQKQQDAGALNELRAKIRPFVLRRTKASQLSELPPKIEQVNECLLTPEQLVVYARTLESVRDDVFRAVESKGFKGSRIEILAALTRLRRICDHPALADTRLPRTEQLSGKMAHALELVRQAVEGNHKVLLFSQFTSMLDILRESLDEHGIGHATIEGKTRDRDLEIKRFNEDPKVSVFLLSLRAGGTGLTLTAADTVILYDPWWNPQVERQAMDRAHRIGQAKTVNVYKIVTQGTIEEKVLALQGRKRQLFDALMEENAEAIRDLTWEDVKDLLG